MYKELLPLRDKLVEELRATLSTQQLPGLAPDKLLTAYVNQLMLYVGMDISNDTISAVVLDHSGELVGSLSGFANEPQGFEHFHGWMEKLRAAQQVRIVVVGGECTGVYYEEFWRYLHDCTDYARVLYNARTTEHMGEALSKRVRDDEVDAYLVAEQVRLGSTPETQPGEDPELLEARTCSRIARETAQEVNRKKNQLKSLLRAFNPAFCRVFPKDKFWSAPAQALLHKYVFPEDFIAAGVDQLTVDLAEASRGRLDRAKAESLIAACQTCYATPGQRVAVRQRVLDLAEDIVRLKKRQRFYQKRGYKLIEHRPETPLVRSTYGAGVSNTLAIVSEIGGVERFPDGKHLASFLGITSSKHKSGTTLLVSKGITKQGSPNARFAVCNLADFLRRRVPKYQAMYERIKNRKPPRKGHRIAVVAVARDFVTNVLYDMLTNKRPFFIEVDDYKKYCHDHQAAA
jgi:transposase